MIRIFMLAVVLLMASGCAKKYCEQERDFQTAREYPPLSAPEGLAVPPQDPNMVIPEARGDERTAINEQRRCLEIPPRMRDGA